MTAKQWTALAMAVLDGTPAQGLCELGRELFGRGPDEQELQHLLARRRVWRNLWGQDTVYLWDLTVEGDLARAQWCLKHAARAARRERRERA